MVKIQQIRRFCDSLWPLCELIVKNKENVKKPYCRTSNF